ncbi:SUMO-specific isopeptidase USPL1 [Aulostomus maculatus]
MVLKCLLKVLERAASLENCPWCSSKGLTYALRSYRINLQESIVLCTNPQCLFPLVSQPLEDVLASLVPSEPPVGNKRKKDRDMEEEELIVPKHLRSCELDNLGPQLVTDVSQTVYSAVNIVSNGQHTANETEGEKVDGHRRECPVAETKERESPQDLEKKLENAACADGLTSPPASAGFLQSSSEESMLWAKTEEPALSPHHDALRTSEDDFRQGNSTPGVLSNQPSLTNVSINSTEIDTPLPQENEQTEGTQVNLTDIRTRRDIESDAEDLFSTSITESKELALFWRNSFNLCWLDVLLVALVNCKSLKRCKPQAEPRQSAVWRLMRDYESICTDIQVCQQVERDGSVTVPNHVLQKADADLQSLRMSIFKLLELQLRCKLGKKETPVFALPLLLLMDSWVEPLFQSTFRWEFQCSGCKAHMQERVTKTLPTFTKIVHDWQPLNASHLAPCNVCRKRNQRRTMVLENVPPVFVLHFVEGLLDNDVTTYSFNFKGKRHSITTVIQYKQQPKHFVTWIRKADGSWLEFDDLKHPDCWTHPKLPVPPQEMHLVFWEVESNTESPVRSPSSSLAQAPASQTEMSHCPSDHALEEDEQLILSTHNDTDIICALSGDNSIINTTVTSDVDAPIASTTLLDAFEGLSHNDIITLTLVELKEDSEMPPSDSEPTQDSGVLSRNKVPDPADSSTVNSANKMSHDAEVKLPTSPGSPTSSSESNDPSYVPGSRGGRGRGRRNAKGKTASRPRNGKKAAPAASSEPSEEICNSPSGAAAQDTAPPASSAPSEVKGVVSFTTTGQDKTPHVETVLQVSPESSTDTSLQSSGQVSQHQNARWSFLLSRYPLNPAKTSTTEPAPTSNPYPLMRIKPPLQCTSTPNSVRQQQQGPAVLFPKPQLRTEESNGLPLKAAERYVAFGAKSSIAPNPPPTPPRTKSFQHITNDCKPQSNGTAISGTSLPVPPAKSEISFTNKHSSRPSKVLPGLSDTEALRYKLLKKLKAKKKKLAKLNQLLGHHDGAGPQPDSTELNSPSTVTSSTYDGSSCDQFLSELLSPATTASNLSPDSSGFPDTLTGKQDGVENLDVGVYAVPEAPQTNTLMNSENFLDEFLWDAVTRQPTDMETDTLNALDIFL